MPKEKSNRSSSSRKGKSPLYEPYGKAISTSLSGYSEGEVEGEGTVVKEEWEAAICPICLDSPHNAVLLLCTSYEKGCRPYMCDTSYRHSNCFDQFRKATHNNNNNNTLGGFDSGNGLEAPESLSGRLTRLSGRHYSSSLPSTSTTTSSNSIHHPESSRGPLLRRYENRRGKWVPQCDLLCPLCRGKVEGWEVVDTARRFLNAKKRSCAHEACAYTGSYNELRAHARAEHPLARPSQADPTRQRDWHRLERRRDIGDVLSTIRSALPGASIVGDYAIDNEGEEGDETDNNNTGYFDFPDHDGHWWTFFLLFQVFGPSSRGAGGARMAPPLSRPHAPPRSLLHRSSSTRRRGLWGESLLYGGSRENHSSSGGSDTGEQPTTTRQPRRHRHRSQHRSHGDVI